MRSRMDRYIDLDKNNQNHSSRQQKNRELYQNIGTNTKYTNFTDVSNINAVSLDEARKNYRTREGYQTIKEYKYSEEKPKIRRELDEFNHLYQDHENRVYDINSVIEQAKANRKDKDELEEKRNLKNTNYNILANLNPEELEKYRNEKNKSIKPDDNELRGLIDTITSKTLAGEISKEASVDLLSDLMATTVQDKVDPIDNKTSDGQLYLSQEILDKQSMKRIDEAKKKVEKKESEVLKDMDDSFYTKSMDLSDKDFDFSDIDEKKAPIIIKILLILILIAAIAATAYYLYYKF